jgi:hypothetical protein
MSETIRLFVGTSACNEDLEAMSVLEYTARKYCSLPLEITWMRQAASGPWSGWQAGSWRTPFTGFRWALPSICNYQGRALYTDVDFFFCADLAELWTQPIPNVALVRNPTGKISTSCILFDCDKAKGIVHDLRTLRIMSDAHGTTLKVFRTNPQYVGACEGNWDCGDLRGYELGDPRVKAIHYTRIETQLHLKHAIPRLAAEGQSHWYQGEARNHERPELQALFDSLLIEAAAHGYGIERYRTPVYAGAVRKDFRYKHHLGTARA